MDATDISVLITGTIDIVTKHAVLINLAVVTHFCDIHSRSFNSASHLVRSSRFMTLG